ncbi:BadF/BadG/BcrA/BcrD ATPase family protein [Haliovirga abyssi]|uniref:Kinase n=1 Tax=Haliovirga abyssi TaxID=2996794 RepID=A0AAU9E4Y0_9FUSO|nr:BadF/BadG/BcrA/BcrD ATPase family protein [Haliovirga abyssi]BDU51585.1 kinase [Haliovirga abyssi]
MYIAGFDGGGTKTHCIIGDENGNILATGNGGPANYQTAGVKRAKKSIEEALEEALLEIGISKNDIDLYMFGLAGADQEQDFEIIHKFIKEIVGDKKYKIYHDSWIGLRSGSEDYSGIVAICGTGSGFSGRRKDGKEIILRNLDYQLGNSGGGNELAEKAIHFAFRSEEGTFDKTELENVIPKLFSVKDMEEVAEIIRNEDISEKVLKKIPIEVFKLANRGDRISQELLISMGETLGRYSASIIKKLEQENEEINIILIGSIYKGESPLLIDSMKQSVRRFVPKAKLIRPDKDPVYGAYFLGVDIINKKIKL